MSSLDAVNAPQAEGSSSEQDLGPLAWVLEELRKSLDGAVKALRRFVHEAELARESDLASLDVSSLRMARQLLHQSGGALEMVGMASPALVLRAMESAVQRFVQRPELCTDDAAGAIERSSFALSEYLESVLAGKPVSPVALFPQYRDVQSLTGVERVHPADLWPVERRFREPDVALPATAVPYDAAARARLDHAVLRIVKDGDFRAARDLRDLSLGLAAGQTDRQVRAFWKICAGYFEGFARGLIGADVYAKRVASRILIQYATLARGDMGVADRLVQDLLFFCGQAKPPEGEDLPCLTAVRKAFGLDRSVPVDYEARRFGRFDPAVLAQARKRIAAAAETWSAFAGGDRNKLKPSSDQFSLVCDSLRKLHRSSEPLAQALTRAVEQTARSGEPPAPALAMEVATSVLYLQAALEETDTPEEQLLERSTRLADRLGAVCGGAEPEPLEPWMEDLYRRVSDNQTMGSVVDELRATLGEAERSMDQFFRNPDDASPLSSVPGRLAQMRGVLSVLGLDQASIAVLRMREAVERLMVDAPTDEAQRKQTFEKLGNSLGALGFLIDMLSYQRAMARKLFVYDEELGELRLLMGRSRPRASDPDDSTDELAHKIEERAPVPLPDVVPRSSLYQPPTLPTSPEVVADLAASPPAALMDELLPHAPEPEAAPEQAPALDAEVQSAAAPAFDALATIPVSVPVAASAPPASLAEEDDELLGIFLEEAREVVTNGLAAIQTLRSEPGDLSEQTTLRRAFHTLKGSSRMVGLNEFGEAAWSMEQLLNAWLAEQKPMQPPLLDLSDQALHAFARWADDIAKGQADAWQASAFSAAADALRLRGEQVGLALPGQAPVGAVPASMEATQPLELPVAEHVPEEDSLHMPDFSDTAPLEFPELGEAAAAPAPASVALAEDIDFSEFSAALGAQTAAATEASASIQAVDLLLDVPEVVSPPEGPVDMPVAEELPVLEALPNLASDVLEEPDTLPPAFEGEPQAQDAQALVPVQELAPEDIPAEASVQAEGASAPVPLDESVKVIGDLRISIPLYNVYLNEADEWSRRLVTCLQEWSMELQEPLPDTAVALAHSLAGSSATVGFNALSDAARLLEHALEHVQLQARGTAEDAQTFLEAAEDIRRLLHQFAAGFLKEAQPEVLEALRRILETEVVSTQSPPVEDAEQAMEAWRIENAQALLAQEAAQAEEPVADTASFVPEETTPATPAPVVHAPVAPPLSVVAPVQAAAPAPEPAGVALDIDDDIDAVDVIDPDLFPIFEEEAAELLPALGGALRQWAARPDNMGARTEVLRALHTLKGSARLAGAMRLGEMAHRLESAIEQIDVETVQSGDVEPLLGSFDGLQANFGALRAISAQAPTEALVVTPARGDEVSAVPLSAEPAGEMAAGTTAPAVPVQARPVLARPQTLDIAPARPAAAHSVRVRAQLLDRLVNQAGEVMITRSRMEARLAQLRSSMADLTGNLERLRQQLRDIELQSESQMQSRLAQSKDTAAGFDPLEFDRFTRVQELTRMMAESVNDVATIQRNLLRAMEGTEDDLIAQGRQARELQRDLLRTRMVEFEGISERLYAVVRQAAKETGKQIKLDITGGSIEMDRGVLDRMTPAFEHLLRNCVAHGIEMPDQRTGKGKPASGTITIDLQHEGNDVSVAFRDDGAGLNLPAIRSKAVAQGLVAADASISDAEAANLIFTPGFSTASEVSSLAGRGIGMDVVRAEVNALGGRIETQTEADKGTSFRMVLPLTTAVTQVVMLRAGDLAVGIPANLVEIVRRVPSVELEAAYRSGVFEMAGESLPFFWCGALLQASQHSTEPAVGKTRPVVILRSAAQRIAMHVDEVLGNREVVVKNLGPQLSRLPGLAGMSVLASGAVVLIYNPVALATVYGEQIRATASSLPLGAVSVTVMSDAGTALPVSAAPAAGQVPLVLVVDDSITVRRVTQRLLQREGYRVALAADGLQALEKLQEERPTVVLSDIEMPRMDGFDLARNIRADARLHDLPIIMITSRIAQKHREHAMELGVNHYLGKPYSDDELLGLIQHYAQQAQAAAPA
ncbi:MAG: Hpt domain-containing protein [Giesbergeria sp.]